MKYIRIAISLITFAYFSVGGSLHAASRDIEGWHVTYENMNCVADGVALDSQNNYIWKIRLAHPAQNQLKLLVGLYNSEVAKMFKGKPIKDNVKFSLLINDIEFQAQDFMFDEIGTLVLDIDNSNTLQSRILENTKMSIIVQPNENSEKSRLATLHVSKVKPAFEWLHRCTVFGLRSIQMR